MEASDVDIVKIDDPKYARIRAYCHEEIRKIHENARMMAKPYVETLNRINQMEMPSHFILESELNKQLSQKMARNERE